MKIIVEGYLIDTKYIIYISPIKLHNESFRTYKFEIVFINKKTIRIKNPLKDDLEKEREQKIENIRNKIIEYWNKDEDKLINNLPVINYE